MDIQTLLNSLTAGGFEVTPHGAEGVAILGPTETLTPTLKAAIREHKGTLRRLACIPDLSVDAEREAIIWVDTPQADVALEQAIADWDNLPEPSDACAKCGGLYFRWDIEGNCHCVRCSPGQSQRLMALAEKLRKHTGKMQQTLHNVQDASGGQTRDASNRNL